MCVYVPVQSTITNKKAIKREHRHETEREKGTKLRYRDIAYTSLIHLDTDTLAHLTSSSLIFTPPYFPSPHYYTHSATPSSHRHLHPDHTPSQPSCPRPPRSKTRPSQSPRLQTAHNALRPTKPPSPVTPSSAPPHPHLPAVIQSGSYNNFHTPLVRRLPTLLPARQWACSLHRWGCSLVVWRSRGRRRWLGGRGVGMAGRRRGEMPCAGLWGRGCRRGGLGGP